MKRSEKKARSNFRGFSPAKKLLRASLLHTSLLCAGFVACSPQPQSVTRMEFLIGTVCTLTLYDTPGEEVFRKVFDRVREIETRMSFTLPESDIGRVNAAAGKFPVSVTEETFALVEEGLEFSRLSGGAFNIAVGPLIALWGIGTERAALPQDADIATRMRICDFTRVVLNKTEKTIFLEEAGMALDLGAIAKGYAADEAARILREEGISRGIIDFGGNIFVLGQRSGAEGWRVGVQNPAENRGQYFGIITAGDLSVVSSGVYERFFIAPDGQRYHHILDTKTGHPVRNGLTQVTVASRSSTRADAFSTTLFVLGLEAGMELAEKTEGIEALFVTEDKKLYASRGMKEIFSLTDQSFAFETEF
jgi:thiamine biosynthesis lipoprotein